MQFIDENSGNNPETYMLEVENNSMTPEELATIHAQAEEVRIEELSRSRTRGFIIRCDGEHAVVAASVAKGSNEKENYWAVGQLISIKVGLARVVGLTCKVEVPEKRWNVEDENEIHVTLELVGEIDAGADGQSDSFSSGISSYPQMGCIAHRIRSGDLEAIYKSEGDSVVTIGSLTQDPTIDAKIDIDKLLSRHFAVVGTTGVGKSTSVTLIMRKIIKARPDIRILMLDPHNEFASAFPDSSIVVDSSNLSLPFWLFTLEEVSEVIFRGQDGFDAEQEILSDLIPLAKQQYRAESDSKTPSLAKKKTHGNITPDTPIPYRLDDLIKLIDDRLGKLDGRAEKPILKSLLYRIESVSNDPRFRFMFEAGQGGDVMESIMSTIFRVPHNGKPICVLEMSGLPSEVVNSCVSVLCRMAFELAMASDGGIQTLVVCEEAHRYIPADKSAGFWPTRQAIARIAKEGRKYGVFLSIITQRPGELDPTILSQCNTLFAMRLGNQNDQEIIRGAVSNGAKSTIGFLSSIANRECIAFGEAIHTPMRLMFETMKASELPGSRIYEQQEAVKKGLDISMSAVMRRMRKESGKPSVEAPTPASAEQRPASVDAASSNQRFSEQPGDDINSILNAAYSGGNGSLNPAPSPGRFGGREGAPQQRPIPTPTGQMHAGTPSMETPVASPRQPEPAPAAKPAGGVNSLINSFRKR